MSAGEVSEGPEAWSITASYRLSNRAPFDTQAWSVELRSSNVYALFRRSSSSSSSFLARSRSWLECYKLAIKSKCSSNSGSGTPLFFFPVAEGRATCSFRLRRRREWSRVHGRMKAGKCPSITSENSIYRHKSFYSEPRVECTIRETDFFYSDSFKTMYTDPE